MLAARRRAFSSRICERPSPGGRIVVCPPVPVSMKHAPLGDILGDTFRRWLGDTASGGAR
jgi:hypothetical protein